MNTLSAQFLKIKNSRSNKTGWQASFVRGYDVAVEVHFSLRLLNRAAHRVFVLIIPVLTRDAGHVQRAIASKVPPLSG